MLRRTTAEASLGPSRTTIISNVYDFFEKYCCKRLRVEGNLSASLYAGTITDRYALFVDN